MGQELEDDETAAAPASLSSGQFSVSLSTSQKSVLSTMGLARPREDSARDAARYVDEQELGRGGMGRVHRVLDTDLGRRVAMKTLLRPEEGLPELVEEAQVNASLEHPNVLPIYDLGVTEEREVYFTMKYVEGHDSVRRIVVKLRDADPEYVARYTFERRVRIVQQICNALQHAHEAGVCHRDVKPENIIVGGHGEVYLADWGVATLAQNGAAPDFAGTAKYMSPERLAGKAPRFDPASDVYSLSAVLYELLTLHYYVGGGASSDPDAMLALLDANELVKAKHFASPELGSVPPALSHVCDKGLARDPAQRFQSAAELEQALERWLSGRAPVACPRTAIQSGLCASNRFLDRHMVLGPVLFAGLALLVLGAIAYTVVDLIAG
jgi:serine/threonine protein kinase